VTDGRDHPLTEVTSELPEWAKWVLHGILLGRPLDAQDVQRRVINADPAPDLPDVRELDTASPVTLTGLRLGDGCYGLAAGTTIEFGRRLTLIYGENGTGKSSVSRVLRAMAGRPSARRPPQDAFTGTPAEATLRVHSDAEVEHQWRAGEVGCVPHIEVFDSADTHVEGTEYQVRPRTVLALEELRIAVDTLRFTVEPVNVPEPLRAALTVEDTQALDEPAGAVAAVESWRAPALPPRRPVTEIEQDLAELADVALASRLDGIRATGRVARAESVLLAALTTLDLPALSARLRAAAAATPDLTGAQPPRGVDPDTWLALLRHALPVFERSPQRCVLCGSDITDRHAELVTGYRALLDDQRAVAARDADTAAMAVREAMLAHQGATGSVPSPLRDLADAAVGALGDRDTDRLDAALTGTSAMADAVETRLQTTIADWHRTDALVKDAENRRTALREELAEARRAEAVAGDPDAIATLLEQLRRRERLAAARAQLQGTKQRINTALRKHTEDALEAAYGEALAKRLAFFRVPHTDRLTARHRAKGGSTTRHHDVGKLRTDILFSEGEQRALALADFAAELDTRAGAKHPVVIDDPVSSLDYRRLDHVVDFVRQLLDQDRQVVVLTHSLWLAAAVLKDVKKPPRDQAWVLMRGANHVGATAPITTHVLGNVEELENRIEAVIADAEREIAFPARHELISHGLGLLRAWCESFIEQKTLCGAVTRLSWQVKPAELRNLDQRKIDSGRAIARLYEKLHPRIGAHAQPGELLHRPDGLTDLQELWAEAKHAKAAPDGD